MPDLLEQTIAALEDRLAYLEAHFDSDPCEQVRIRIALFEPYEDILSLAQLLDFVAETYILAQQFDSSPDPEIMLACLSYLASACNRLGQVDQGLCYALTGLEYVNMEHPTKYMARLFGALGALYSGLGKFDEALLYTNQALAWTIELRLTAYQGRLYLNLAYLYSHWNKSDQALETLHRVLLSDIYDCLPINSRAMLHNNLASEYMTQGNLDVALSHAKQSIEIYEMALALCTLGEVFMARKDYARAEETLDRAIALADQEQDHFAANAIGLARGALYRCQGQLTAAITVLEQMLAANDPNKLCQAQALQLLSTLYEDCGMVRQAYQTFQRYLELKTELVYEQVEQRTRALEMTHRIALARQETICARKEQTDRQTYQSTFEQLVAERNLALAQQQELRQSQQAVVTTIAELSAPLLRLLPGVFVLPLIGPLDEQQITRITETLSSGISEEETYVVLLDMMRAPMGNTPMTKRVLDLAQAITQLGGRLIIVGITQEITQTLLGLEMSFGEIMTYTTLEEGLAQALALVGLQLVQKHPQQVCH